MRRLAFVLMILIAAAAARPAWSAPKAELWARWTSFDAASTLSVDHSLWQGLLTAYVGPDAEGVNRVAYGRFTEVDRKALDSYIAYLGKMPMAKLGRAEQLALWVNLYNALTVRVVLQHYPVASIRDIDTSPGLFANGPWGEKLATVDGERVSLDDIEHRILRPIWMDPRIHYALNCASVGCPNLQVTAFTAKNVDDLLTKAARGYVNDPRGVRLEGGKLTVSSLYDWYKADFGGTDETVIAHLKRYAEGALKAPLDEATKVDGYIYDWALNDAK